jgi:propionyl-CoA carboxylase alpha chain
VAAWSPGNPLLRLHENGGEYVFTIARLPGGIYQLTHGGARLDVSVRRPGEAELVAHIPKRKEADTSKMLHCPMPGMVVSINVGEGQEVKTGETLAVVEAMKMENVLTAEHDATVKKINVKKGDNLAFDDVILEFA